MAEADEEIEALQLKLESEIVAHNGSTRGIRAARKSKY